MAAKYLTVCRVGPDSERVWNQLVSPLPARRPRYNAYLAPRSRGQDFNLNEERDHTTLPPQRRGRICKKSLSVEKKLAGSTA